MFHSIQSLLLLIAFIGGHATKFPNDVQGLPQITCEQDRVSLKVATSNGLPSFVFAKGHFGESGCSVEKVNEASFSLAACGMARQRQLDPKGVMFSLVVLVQLHPLFITKVDKAYNIKCFYMEVDKGVTAGIEVSMLTTSLLTAAAPMPQCSYTLHSESPNGPTVKYARVGDKVWHVWSCPSGDGTVVDGYRMLLHSCTVEDGQGKKISIIDDNGCGVDQYVLRTPNYNSDLTGASQETHVFKFADKVSLFFNCQIKLCAKSASGCLGITIPPVCANSSFLVAPLTQQPYLRTVSSDGGYPQVQTQVAPIVNGGYGAVIRTDASSITTDTRPLTAIPLPPPFQGFSSGGADSVVNTDDEFDLIQHPSAAARTPPGGVQVILRTSHPRRPPNPPSASPPLLVENATVEIDGAFWIVKQGPPDFYATARPPSLAANRNEELLPVYRTVGFENGQKQQLRFVRPLPTLAGQGFNFGADAFQRHENAAEGKNFELKSFRIVNDDTAPVAASLRQERPHAESALNGEHTSGISVVDVNQQMVVLEPDEDENEADRGFLGRPRLNANHDNLLVQDPSIQMEVRGNVCLSTALFGFLVFCFGTLFVLWFTILLCVCLRKQRRKRCKLTSKGSSREEE